MIIDRDYLEDLYDLEDAGELSPADTDDLYDLEHRQRRAARLNIAPLFRAGRRLYPLVADLDTLLRFVNSSNLDYIAYNSRRKQLDIKFLSGHIYRYYSVPYKTYRNMVRAKSHGKNFWKNVRRPLPRGKFRYRRIA